MTPIFFTSVLISTLWIYSLAKKGYNWLSLWFDFISLLIFAFIGSIVIEETKLYSNGQSGDSFAKFTGNLLILIFPAVLLKCLSLVMQKTLPVKESVGLSRFRWLLALIAIGFEIARFLYLRDLHLIHQEISHGI
jgi:uncharacterized membrane protein YeiH